MSQPWSERFTDSARRVFQLANDEAHRLNHAYIGTGDVLLGLIAEGHGVASQVLMNLGLDPYALRQQVEDCVASDTAVISYDALPQSPRVLRVLEHAIDEARLFAHDYVGTEHILLGLLREQDGAAAGVLIGLGVTLEQARTEVQSVLRQAEQDQAEHAGAHLFYPWQRGPAWIATSPAWIATGPSSIATASTPAWIAAAGVIVVLIVILLSL